MNEDKFWTLIDAVNSEATENKQKKALLVEELSILPIEEVAMFDFIMRELHYKAETWDLVAVDKIFYDESMMSEDHHYRFNFAVISLGKQRFYEILNNADEMIHHIPESVPFPYHGFSFENEGYIDDAMFELTFNKIGKELFEQVSERVSQDWKKQNSDTPRGCETHGYKAESLEELEARLPKIWKRFEKHRDYGDVFHFWLNDYD
jgi:Protein of unknown function (DUF4240)